MKGLKLNVNNKPKQFFNQIINDFVIENVVMIEDIVDFNDSIEKNLFENLVFYAQLGHAKHAYASLSLFYTFFSIIYIIAAFRNQTGKAFRGRILIKI